MSVCLSVYVYTITQKNYYSIHLKLELIAVHVYENSADEYDIGWALSLQGQVHNMTLKFFSICHNTNFQVLYFSLATC